MCAYRKMELFVIISELSILSIAMGCDSNLRQGSNARPCCYGYIKQKTLNKNGLIL